MKELVALVRKLVDRIPWPGEELHKDALDLLDRAEISLGLKAAAPPASVTPAPVDGTPADPAVAAAQVSQDEIEAKAKELLASGWTPSASPEVTGSPEETSAFAGVTPSPPAP